MWLRRLKQAKRVGRFCGSAEKTILAWLVKKKNLIFTKELNVRQGRLVKWLNVKERELVFTYQWPFNASARQMLKLFYEGRSGD